MESKSIQEFTLSGYMKELGDKFVNTSDMSNEDKIFHSLKLEVGKKDENDKTGLDDAAIKAEVEGMSAVDKVREVSLG